MYNMYTDTKWHITLHIYPQGNQLMKTFSQRYQKFVPYCADKYRIHDILIIPMGTKKKKFTGEWENRIINVTRINETRLRKGSLYLSPGQRHIAKCLLQLHKRRYILAHMYLYKSDLRTPVI